MRASKSRVQGLIVGQAIGDMMGAPLEFLRYPDYLTISNKFVGGLVNKLVKGRHTKFAYTTDDTAHLLIAVESFISCGKFSMEDYMERLIKWYEGGSAKGLGGSTAIACHLMDPEEQDRPTHWKNVGRVAREKSPYFHQGRNNESGYEISSAPSNGPLMRCSFVGLSASDKTLKSASHSSTTITHDFEISYKTALALATMVKMVIDGKPKDEIQNEIVNQFSEVIKECELALSPDFGDAMGDNPAVGSNLHIGYGGGCATSLAIVMNSFFTTNSYEEAIIKAINARTTYKPWCWDVDTYGAITGALAGSYYGIENIPQHWIDIVDTETNIPTSMEPVSIEKLLVLGEILTQKLDIFEIGRTL